jgi:predicted GNAT family acetyltransferase
MSNYRATYKSVKGEAQSLTIDRYATYYDAPSAASVARTISRSGLVARDFTDVWDDVGRSVRPLSTQTYWVGSEITPQPGAYDPDYVRPAVARVTREAAGGSLSRAAKLLTGIGRTVVLELFVQPEHRRKGIATALAYAALGDFNDKTRTVIDVPSGNESLEHWVAAYGYTPASVGPEGKTVRYEAQAGDVRSAMLAAQPWLQQADFESFSSPWAAEQYMGPY